MEDFVAYPSRWRLSLMALCSAALVALGLWLGGALGPPLASSLDFLSVEVVFGWLGVIFFGLCFVAAVKRLLDNGEQLRIGAAGVRWALWSDQTIPWVEITDVTTWSVERQKGIVLHLRDPSRFPGRGPAAIFARVDRLLTGGHIAITLAGTDRSFDEALSAIARFRPCADSRLPPES